MEKQTKKEEIKWTPCKEIMRQILMDADKYDGINLTSKVITPENIEKLYEELLIEEDLHWDYESEFRCGEVETNLDSEYSRHYESKSVAALLDSGKWVGWTYWYGGGKHGEPEAIDWMTDAYFLECIEEEKVVVVRNFFRETDEE